jgi:hypothetical protein
MAAQLFLDYGLIALFPFFLLALNGITKIFEASVPSTSTSQLLTAALNPINYLHLSANITASVYLVVLSSLLLVVWIIYICCAVPASSFEPLWAKEWHAQIINPHFWDVALIEREGVALEAFSLQVDALLLTQALDATPESHRLLSLLPKAVRHRAQK